MPVPLALSVPAAAAGLAYLNARSSLWHDFTLLGASAATAVPMLLRGRQGKLNLFYVLEKRAQSQTTANRPFILFEDKSYTYAEVYERVLRYGTWLKETMGVKEKDFVALDFMNSDTYIFLWLGLWAIGATPAFINYHLRDKALVHCVNAAGTKLMLVDNAVAQAVSDNVKEALPGVRIEVFNPQLEAEATASPATRYPDEVRRAEKINELAVLIYTSGTTGHPKAAVVSWGKVIVAGGVSSAWARTRRDDIYYTCMPMYHSSAILLCWSNVLSAGATMAIGRRFSNKTFWPDVRRHKATMIQYVGETCRYLLAAPPDIDLATGENLDKKHNVRTALGNGLRPDIWNRFKERFGIEAIAEFYGATEGSLATFNFSRNDFGMGAVGRIGWVYAATIGRGAAVVTVDHDTDMPYRDPQTGLCQRVKRGEPGEFIFQLPADNIAKRFQGYHGNQAATTAKVLRGVFKKDDAWFRSGDVVRWDADGRIYFQDRLGDTFRWKSENVSTTEVAHVLGQHPAVHDANVYGVALPHHDGRAGCVALVLAGGEASGQVLASLARHVRQGLPRYATPLFLRVVQDASKYATGTNKQQKHVLREQGVSPQKVGGDSLFWLTDGGYEKFSNEDWARLNRGLVKL